ncbi:AraC-type DNA-binding protein [Chitinophaga jiangningensis]|uniref:AraC-type DNA-binding protein n=1 Tax=Chitinophaga jiangningensis TaxID=1419482 RepID=A0A1M7DZ50_9BACT|nr:AraC family transcriptional regulator [Chitinophaga jiangningensis]SHL84774.1 AraC-type DNA-binding protein [Chitinophaga jiangningensis]
MSSKRITRSNEIRTLKMTDIQDNLSLYQHFDVQPKVPVNGTFAAYSRQEHPVKEEIGASRRDYYKISLVTAGEGIFTMDGVRHEVKGPTIIFINPHTVKTWTATTKEQDGYYCLFTEELFYKQPQELLTYPLLQAGSQSIYPITNEQAGYLSSIFRQLAREFQENAAFKQEAILIYIKLLLLEGRRIAMETAAPERAQTAAQQLAYRFTDKLEKQFPIEHPTQQIGIKTAKEFAAALNTHPNHLNACVKTATGRTISEHIRQRILLEAKLLLMHSDWQIAEIAWCLGFEDPGNFTHFFRNHSQQSPQAFRQH